MYVLECQLQTVGNRFCDPMSVAYILLIARGMKQYRGPKMEKEWSVLSE